MSVGLNAANEYLGRSASVPTETPFSAAWWMYVSDLRSGNRSGVFQFLNGTGTAFTSVFISTA